MDNLWVITFLWAIKSTRKKIEMVEWSGMHVLPNKKHVVIIIFHGLKEVGPAVAKLQFPTLENSTTSYVSGIHVSNIAITNF